MNLTTFNACLLAGLVLVAIGSFLIATVVGFIVTGAALIALTVYVAAKFGVYATSAKAPATNKPEAE